MAKNVMNEEKRNENYNKYVDTVTPKASCIRNCAKAFVTGGIICTYGQGLLELFKWLNFGKDEAALYTILCMILTSVILTGFGVYPLVTTWGGAGSLVPITGFANSVAAAAVEYKKEGQVFGIGCKIFTIAGPVILYGIFASFLLGLAYWIVNLW